MGQNTDLITSLYQQGKILTPDAYTFWLYTADMVETWKNPDLPTIDYYLGEANREYEAGGIFADYRTYDQIYDMVVGGPIISLAEYETYGLVSIQSYGAIEDWDKVLDISLAVRGPAGLTSAIQWTIKQALELNGLTPLQIHVLASPGIKVLNFPLTADYKIRVYYHNPSGGIAALPIIAPALLIAIIVVALMLLGIAAVVTNMVGKVSDNGLNTKKIEASNAATKALQSIAADTTQTPEIRAAAAEALVSSLQQVIKNAALPAPKTLGEQVSDIGNTLIKLAIAGGLIYLGWKFLPTLIPPARERLRKRLA